jgi:hypothetical protein
MGSSTGSLDSSMNKIKHFVSMMHVPFNCKLNLKYIAESTFNALLLCECLGEEKEVLIMIKV